MINSYMLILTILTTTGVSVSATYPTFSSIEKCNKAGNLWVENTTRNSSLVILSFSCLEN
jgi:hypothetical protein